MWTDGFRNKVAFVTGAAAGIGLAIAERWTAMGGIVVVTDRDAGALDQAVARMRAAGARAHGMPLDVADAAGIRTCVVATVEIAGGLDAVFNVAGINIPKTVETIEEDEWQSVLDVNLTSIYRVCKQALPHLRRRGGGAIVNISSIAGVMAEGHCSAYTASKGGVVLLTRNMAMDFARDNVRVNAICPGSTRSPRTERYWKMTPKGKSEMAELCPMMRSAEPEEIAEPALFLASPGASYITGAALVVDGGMTAGFRVPTFERM